MNTCPDKMLISFRKRSWSNLEWKYRLFINDVFWKGYGGYPTVQQLEVERRSYKNSGIYKGGKIKIEVA